MASNEVIDLTVSDEDSDEDISTVSDDDIANLSAKRIKKEYTAACHKNYDNTNDTIGLLVSRAERRLISKLAIG